MITEEKIFKIAEHNGVDVSYENLGRILKAKKVFKLGIYCPCCPDDKDRYCGSKKCMEEVRKNKSCHCGLFVKKGK